MLNPKNVPSRNLDLPEDIREVMQLRTFERPENMLKTDWDLRFLELAKFISTWSKDPSTKCGAVIIDPDKRILSVGFNGFPKKIKDTEDRYNDRPIKYKLVMHAEENAILFAKQNLTNCVLYTWPCEPCAHCSSIIVQADIMKVIAPPTAPEVRERWGETIDLAKTILEEGGVTLFNRVIE